MPEPLLIFLGGLAPSDFVILFIVTPLAALFFVAYVAFPGWWRVRDLGLVGYMTTLHSLSILLFLLLIVYAIIAGERVAEWARLPITVLLAFALVSKVVILFYERRQGYLARMRARRSRSETEVA